jgi:nicotinic acid mononucleotide adenylyltransferase
MPTPARSTRPAKPAPATKSKPTALARTAPTTPIRLPRRARVALVFGGSFDPPTLFHWSAVTVPGALGLRDPQKPDTVATIFIPAAISPLKGRGPVVADEHRVAMLLAHEGMTLNDQAPTPWASIVWTDEIDRARWHAARAPGAAARANAASPIPPSYTIDTLERLRAAIPARVALRLLIGADQAVKFDQWRRPRDVIALAEPLVMLRPPYTTPAHFLDALAQAGRSRAECLAWARRLVPMEAHDDSSTRVRAMLRTHPPSELAQAAMIAPGVADYIERHGLYAPPPARASTARRAR